MEGRAGIPKAHNPYLRGWLSYSRGLGVWLHTLFEFHQPPPDRRLKHQRASVDVIHRQQVKLAALRAPKCLTSTLYPHGFAVVYVGAPAAIAATNLLHGSLPSSRFQLYEHDRKERGSPHPPNE
jgi:hypothetical protein